MKPFWRLFLSLFLILGINNLVLPSQAEVKAETEVVTATPTIIYVPSAQSPTINAAVALVPDGGIIELAAGTYTERVIIQNQARRFTIRAATGATVVIKNGASGTKGVLTLKNDDITTGRHLVFENLIFDGGYSSTDGYGGGVTVDRGEATFINCTIRNNKGEQPTAGGGGMFVTNGSKVFIINSTFSNNTNKNYGGGIALVFGSKGYIYGSTFTGNRTNVTNHRNIASGGGIHVGDSTLRVANSRFDGNKAGYVGGAIYAIGSWGNPLSTPRSDVLIVNTTFNNNQAVHDGSVALTVPTEGGAVHGEDQTTIKIYNSRFTGNSSGLGGGVNLYRAIIEVYDSAFFGNLATGMSGNDGFGGAMSATSNDTSLDGGNNRRSASLTVRNTLIQGSGWGYVTSKDAGGIYAGGDANRMYGQNGVSQNGTAATNRATLIVDKVAFVDLDTSGAVGHGGGLMGDLVNLVMTDCLFLHNRSNSGGAISVIQDTSASITNTTFSANKAMTFGGAIYAQGVQINITGSKFVQNALNNIGSDPNNSYGAALFTAILSPKNLGVSGTVANNIFSENIGLPLYEGDSMSAPINDVRYNSNQFYSNISTFGSNNLDVYTNSNGGYCCRNVSQLNTLTITRNGGVPSTDKSQVDNTLLGSPAVVGTILSVPTAVLQVGAVGESGRVPAYLAYGWSGGTAKVDGGTVNGNWGIRSTTTTGNHNLMVGSTTYNTTVNLASVPAAVLMVAQNGTALQWDITGGAFMDDAIDQGISITPADSGSVGFTYNDLLTYRFYGFTKEGGVVVTQAQDPVLTIGANPIVILIGLNWPDRDGYIPIVNSGGGTLNWTATTGDTGKLTIISPSGSTADFDTVELYIKIGTAGTQNATVHIDAGAGGSEDVNLIIQVIQDLPRVFLPISPRP